MGKGSSVQTVNSADESTNSTTSSGPSSPVFIKVPDFLVALCSSESATNATRETIAHLFDAFQQDEKVSKDADHMQFLSEFEEALNQVLTRTLTARQERTETPAPEKSETTELADRINSQIEQYINRFALQLGSVPRREIRGLINSLQDEVTAALGGKPRFPTRSENPSSKAIIRLYLPLSLSRNSEHTLSEVELVQMALRKFQYDYTRKLTHFAIEELDKDAARVANDLTTADKVAAKLFEAMSATVELLNDSIFGLLPHGREFAYSGHEHNIRETYREHYQEYRDDIERPGV